MSLSGPLQAGSRRVLLVEPDWIARLPHELAKLVRGAGTVCQGAAPNPMRKIPVT